MPVFRVSSRTLGEVDVEAPHWLTALGEGLTRLGAAEALDRIAGETLPNGQILVRNVRTGAGFVVQPLDSIGKEEESIPDFEMDGEEEEAEVEPAGLADELEEIRRSESVADAVEASLDAALARIPANAGSVLLRRDDVLSFVASRGPGWETLANVSIPLGVGVAGFCVRYNTALTLQEAYTDARFFKSVDLATGVRTSTILCVPIACGDVVFGCIELINAPQGFDRYAIACVDALAAAVGERMARD